MLNQKSLRSNTADGITFNLQTQRLHIRLVALLRCRVPSISVQRQLCAACSRLWIDIEISLRIVDSRSVSEGFQQNQRCYCPTSD